MPKNEDAGGIVVDGEIRGEAEPTRAERITSLLARMKAHDAEADAIQKEMAEIGIDVKGVKAIRKAEAEAERARKTLEALKAEGLVK